MKNVYAAVIGGWLAVAGVAAAQSCPTPPAPCAAPADGGTCWGGVEYLLWWVTDSPLTVPLVTSGGTGVPGTPGVSVIYGNSEIDYGTFSGIRLNLGGWIDQDRMWGIDGSGFFLFNDKRTFTAQSDVQGSPSLGQPVVTPGLGDSAYLTAFPGVLYGTISSELAFRFYGWDVNGVANVWRENGLQIDAMLGYRSLRLSEQLKLRSHLRTIVDNAADFLGNPIPAKSALITTDTFGAATEVYAPQLGGHVAYTQDRIGLDATAKVGLGWASEKVAINGSTVFLPPFGSNLPTQAAVGGILATSTNIPGGKTTGRFVVVPEMVGRASYQVTDLVRLSVGYSFLYISEVVRPGGQIDRTVNPNNVPSDRDFGRFVGPARPALDIQHSSFWAHGVSFGAEIVYESRQGERGA